MEIADHRLDDRDRPSAGEVAGVGEPFACGPVTSGLRNDGSPSPATG